MNNWVFLLLWVHFAYCAISSDWRAIFFCFVLKDILKGHLSDCTWIKFKICESYLGHAVMFPLFYIPSRTTLCALNRNSDRSEPPALLERDTPRGVQSGQFSFKRNMLHTEQSHLWGKVFHCGELIFFFSPSFSFLLCGSVPLGCDQLRPEDSYILPFKFTMCNFCSTKTRCLQECCVEGWAERRARANAQLLKAR